MKRSSPYSIVIHSLVCAFLLTLILPGRGQQPPPQGAFRFANACSIPGKTLVTIDTGKLRPDGFGPGENTGMIGILSGAHHFTVVHPTAGKGEANFMVQPDSFTTVVAFPKPAIDPTTKKTVQTLQVLARPDPPREKGKHFQILSVSNRPTVDLSINGQSVSLPSLRELKADEFVKGALKIECTGKPVVDFAAEESGSFLVILFDRPDGTLGGMVMPDYG